MASVLSSDTNFAPGGPFNTIESTLRYLLNRDLTDRQLQHTITRDDVEKVIADFNYDVARLLRCIDAENNHNTPSEDYLQKVVTRFVMDAIDRANKGISITEDRFRPDPAKSHPGINNAPQYNMQQRNVPNQLLLTTRVNVDEKRHIFMCPMCSAPASPSMSPFIQCTALPIAQKDECPLCHGTGFIEIVPAKLVIQD